STFRPRQFVAISTCCARPPDYFRLWHDSCIESAERRARRRTSRAQWVHRRARPISNAAGALREDGARTSGVSFCSEQRRPDDAGANDMTERLLPPASAARAAAGARAEHDDRGARRAARSRAASSFRAVPAAARILAASLLAAGAALCAAPGADAAPLALEKDELRLGFIKLTDMAPLAIAYERGYFEDEGLFVTLEPQANWKVLLDRVITGELDGAHMLAGQPLGASIGIGTTA